MNKVKAVNSEKARDEEYEWHNLNSSNNHFSIASGLISIPITDNQIQGKVSKKTNIL